MSETRLRTRSHFRVRYAETDQMGVVYHTHYLVWCEIGRTDFIRQFGTTYAELEQQQGILLAVAEAQIRYVASARYDDPIVVETWLERAQSRLLTFRYEIYREDASGQLLASATTKLIAMDRNSNPRQLPQELLTKFKHATSPTD